MVDFSGNMNSDMVTVDVLSEVTTQTTITSTTTPTTITATTSTTTTSDQKSTTNTTTQITRVEFLVLVIGLIVFVTRKRTQSKKSK